MSPDLLRNWISGAGGRRFLLTVGAGLVDTLLRVTGYLNEGNYVKLTLATVGAYLTAAGWQKHIEAKGSQ